MTQLNARCFANHGLQYILQGILLSHAIMNARERGMHTQRENLSSFRDVDAARGIKFKALCSEKAALVSTPAVFASSLSASAARYGYVYVNTNIVCQNLLRSCLRGATCLFCLANLLSRINTHLQKAASFKTPLCAFHYRFPQCRSEKFN